MAQTNKKRLLNLLKRTQVCYWCGCQVIKYRLKKHEKVPNNFATLDHLHHRLHPERGQHPNTETTVLSCFECNRKRNEEFWNQLTAEQKRIYSEKIPKLIDVKVTSNNFIIYKTK